MSFSPLELPGPRRPARIAAACEVVVTLTAAFVVPSTMGSLETISDDAFDQYSTVLEAPIGARCPTGGRLPKTA